MLTDVFFTAGTKRYIASLLITLAGICRTIPAVAAYAVILEQAAAVIGGVGIAHAGVKGTVTKFKLSSLASVLSILLAVAPAVPQLAPFVPLLNLLAMLFGAGAVVKGTR